jgi:hypothetical protein
LFPSLGRVDPHDEERRRRVSNHEALVIDVSASSFETPLRGPSG